MMLDSSFKVAVEAIKGLRTINEIASENNVHPNQVSTAGRNNCWKKGQPCSPARAPREQQEQAATEAELYEQIGRLKMELEWLKKKVAPFN
jgi:hypothetical protein